MMFNLYLFNLKGSHLKEQGMEVIELSDQQKQEFKDSMSEIYEKSQENP